MSETLPISIITRQPATGTENLLNAKHDYWFTQDDDMVHRTIVDKSTNSFSMYSSPTADISKQLDAYFSVQRADILALKKFSKWQRKYIDFQATYSAFLLGALSEEEFEADSEQYAPRIRHLEPDQLALEIERLTQLLEFGVRPTELAEYFETEQSVINSALEKINKVLLTAKSA